MFKKTCTYFAQTCSYKRFPFYGILEILCFLILMEFCSNFGLGNLVASEKHAMEEYGKERPA